MRLISPERVASNKILRRWCADITGDVLSIGSGGDIDKQGGHYRDYFSKAASYTTSDIEYEMGCDLVLDARWMPTVRDCMFDAVFVSGVLEHIDRVEDAVAEIWRVTRPGGVAIVGVPFKQPEHRAPNDFWRFTQWAARYLFRKFTIEECLAIGDPEYPFGYWLRARKNGG